MIIDMETIFRFIKHCDDCEKWPKDHWKKKKYYFQAATTMSKLMKAPKLSAWSMINAVGSPLTSLLLLLPLDISRGSHPCKHTAIPPRRRRAGHGSISARARGAPPCKKYNLERGNRPSIQLPTPSPIISFITWMLQRIFGFETLRRYQGPKKGLTDAAIMLRKLNKSLYLTKFYKSWYT